jgi:hypothetical protein
MTPEELEITLKAISDNAGDPVVLLDNLQVLRDKYPKSDGHDWKAECQDMQAKYKERFFKETTPPPADNDNKPDPTQLTIDSLFKTKD